MLLLIDINCSINMKGLCMFIELNNTVMESSLGLEVFYIKNTFPQET